LREAFLDLGTIKAYLPPASRLVCTA